MKKILKWLPHLISAPTTFALLLVIGFLWIYSYSDHNEGLACPDFTNLSIRDANALAEEKGLTLEILDSIYIREATPGSILKQSPEAGHLIKPTRIIYLESAIQQAPQRTIPKIIDLTPRLAKQILTGLNVPIGKITFVPNEFPVVTALSYQGKQVLPGEKIPDGKPLDLEIGKGF